eukprot:COSAG05_NODE_10848_length_542_cov_1.467269_2_plen_57_part_01
MDQQKLQLKNIALELELQAARHAESALTEQTRELQRQHQHMEKQMEQGRYARRRNHR